MNKQDKIKELSKKIEELSAELEKLAKEPDEPIVEVYADSIASDDYYSYLDDGCEWKVAGCIWHGYDRPRINNHNCYRPGQILKQQEHYQKIINRTWQLAYELNPKDWDWKEEITYKTGRVYQLMFNFETSLYVPTCDLHKACNFSPTPKFKTKELAQKAADQLNQDGYKL